jgi:hypothetical protein
VRHHHHHRHNTHTMQVRRYKCKESLQRRKVLKWCRMGRWSHFPLLSIFILLFIVPSHSYHRTGGAPVLSPMPLCLQLIIVDTVGLPSHHILR